MDPDTIMCESLRLRLDFSCAPSHDSLYSNSSLFTILAATSHLAIYQLTGAISCHQTECCPVIGPHSTVWRNSWLPAVSRVPVPPPRSETSGIHGRPVALGSAIAGELHTSSQIFKDIARGLPCMARAKTEL